MVGESAIQRPQERTTSTFEILPGVLTVEDDEDDWRFPAWLASAAAGFIQTSHKVIGSAVGVPTRIGEPDHVRQ